MIFAIFHEVEPRKNPHPLSKEEIIYNKGVSGGRC